MPPTAHLDKVLRHAEQELVRHAHKKPTDLLDLYRRFLKKEEHRIKLAHRAGESGRSITRKRSDLMDVVLRHVWKGAWESTLQAHVGAKPPKICLMTVGGYGRAELCPCSDIDILFLYDPEGGKRSPLVDDIVEQVLYMLWDVGCGVGPATRTLKEQIKLCNEDNETRTASLEARFLCGEKSLYEEFERNFDRQCIHGHQKAYARWREEDQKVRHDKWGNTVFLQEPNVKQGCGGLRDYQNILWLARVQRGIRSLKGLQDAGYLTTTERKRLEEAYDFQLRVRNELHYLQERPGDLLTLHLQGRVANNFRYTHRTLLRRIEALMRDYFHHSRRVYLLGNSLARKLIGANKPSDKPRWSFLPQRVLKPERIDGFVLHEGVLEAERTSVFAEDNMRLMRVFLIAQQRGATIGPDLGLLIRRRLHLINRSFIYHKSVRAMLLTLFSRKGQVGAPCRQMHELGVLGRIFPEFRPLTCLVQHEFFHRYTADEHSLVCLEMLDRIIVADEMPYSRYQPLMQRVERAHILYLAMLLHDTGKADPTRRHEELSATNAVKVARRLKLDPQDLSTLVFLVDHHMTMSDTARRKNLEEESTIVEFARLVQTRERLDLLMLLTFADYQGTDTKAVNSSWKDLLLWQLYERTGICLDGKKEFLEAAQESMDNLREKVSKAVSKDVAADEVAAHFDTLPERYFRNLPERLVIEHVECVHEFLWSQIVHEDGALRPVIRWNQLPDEGHSEVVVVMWDRQRSFAKITGAFAMTQLSILSADIFTRDDDIIINTFRVCTERLEAVEDKRDREAFTKRLTDALAKTDYAFDEEWLAKLHNPLKLPESPSFPPHVHFELPRDRDYVIMDVQAADRPGLLYLIADFLADHHIEVLSARVTTEKGAALDTFYLLEGEPGRLKRESFRQTLARKLQKLLES